MGGGLGLGIGAAVPMAANTVSRVLAPKTRQSVTEMMDAGITPTPGQIMGGGFKQVEEKLASVPLAGDMIARAQSKGIDDFNRAVGNRVLKHLGEKLPDDIPVGREMVDYVHRMASDAYENVLGKIKTVAADDTFTQTIAKLQGMADELPQSRAQQFHKILQERVLGRFKNGAMDGISMKDVDSLLGQKARAYMVAADPDQRQLGAAFAETQKALRELVERTAPNAQVANKLKNANAAWAEWKRLEKAAGTVGAESGVFTPKQYRRAVQASQKGSAYARGNALGQGFSENAVDVLSNTVPNSGTVDRALTTGALGSGALGVLDPSLMAAGGSMAALYTRPAQNTLASLMVRRPDMLRRSGEAMRGSLGLGFAEGGVVGGANNRQKRLSQIGN